MNILVSLLLGVTIPQLPLGECADTEVTTNVLFAVVTGTKPGFALEAR